MNPYILDKKPSFANLTSVSDVVENLVEKTA